MNSGTADWISGSKTLARRSGRSAKVATTSCAAPAWVTASSDRPRNDFGRRDQPALEVVDHVRDLLRRGGAHQNVQAERRRSAGLGRPGAHLTEELRGEFTTAPFLLDRKARTLQEAPIGRGTFDKARLGARGPRHREAQLALAALAHHVVDRETPSRFEHASHFGERLLLVVDVHADMEHVGAVEC